MFFQYYQWFSRKWDTTKRSANKLFSIVRILIKIFCENPKLLQIIFFQYYLRYSEKRVTALMYYPMIREQSIVSLLRSYLIQSLTSNLFACVLSILPMIRWEKRCYPEICEQSSDPILDSLLIPLVTCLNFAYVRSIPHMLRWAKRYYPEILPWNSRTIFSFIN